MVIAIDAGKGTWQIQLPTCNKSSQWTRNQEQFPQHAKRISTENPTDGIILCEKL